MVNNKTNIWIVVGVAIVVAVLASLITVGITGNAVSGGGGSGGGGGGGSSGDILTVYNGDTITFPVKGEQHTITGRYLLNGGEGYAFTLDGTKYELQIGEMFKSEDFALKLTELIIPWPAGRRGAKFRVDVIDRRSYIDMSTCKLVDGKIVTDQNGNEELSLECDLEAYPNSILLDNEYKWGCGG